jgi:hypothetical protein
MPTHTLIAEDVALLLLHDGPGAPVATTTLLHVLGGAVLVELGLRGRIGVDGAVTGPGRPVAVATGAGPLPDPLLARAHAAATRRPRPLGALLPETGADLWRPITGRLVDRGWIRRERRGPLGLYPLTGPPAADPHHEAALRRRLGAVLEQGDRPDAHTAAVIALLSASGALPGRHLSPARAAEVAARAAALEPGDRPTTAAVTAAVRATTAGGRPAPAPGTDPAQEPVARAAAARTPAARTPATRTPAARTPRAPVRTAAG